MLWIHSTNPIHQLLAICTILFTSLGAHGVCTPPSQAKPLYRNFRAGTDHLYTVDANEYNSVPGGGWAQEGIRALVFTSQVEGSVRLRRLWSWGALDHFYTADSGEAASFTAQGVYSYEDNPTPIFVYPSAQCDTVPLYRLYQDGDVKDHFYTADAAERDRAIAIGYTYQLIAGYVYPKDATDPVTVAKTANPAPAPGPSTTKPDAGTQPAPGPTSNPGPGPAPTSIGDGNKNGAIQSNPGTTPPGSTAGLHPYTGSVLPAATSLLPNGSLPDAAQIANQNGGATGHFNLIRDSRIFISVVVPFSLYSLFLL